MDRLIPAFFINLKRNPERRARLEEAFEQFNLRSILDVRWVDAVDGHLLDPSDKSFSVNTEWYEPNHMKPMTKGEVGCALSHYNIWKTIAETEDLALIFEDDIIFMPQFAQEIQSLVASIPPQTDLAYIYRRPLNEAGEKIYNHNWTVSRTTYWACSYLLTKTGAQKIIESNFIQSLTPVDEYLSFMFDQNYRSYISKQMPLYYNYPETFNAYSYRAHNGNICDIDATQSFCTSNTYHSPSFKNLSTNLHLITYCTQSNSALNRWIYSCETYGIPHTVIPMSHTVPPLRFLNKTHIESIDCEYIMWTHPFKSYILGNPVEILEKYRLSVDADETRLLVPAVHGKLITNGAFICKKSTLMDLINHMTTVESVIVGDRDCNLFQYVEGTDPSHIKTTKSLLHNSQSNTYPKVLCSDQPELLQLNYLENFTLRGLKQSYGFKLEPMPNPLPTVDIYAFYSDFLSHDFLSVLTILDYPHDLIKLHVFGPKTNLNVFEHFDTEFIDRRSPTECLQYIAQRSLQGLSRSYVWILHERYVINKPHVLTDCIRAGRDIVAPLITKPGEIFSNFWGALDSFGYYKRSGNYLDIVNLNTRSAWNVPYVHGNILIKSDVFVRNPELFTQMPDMDSDMAFCKVVRDNFELMYVLNMDLYGFIEKKPKGDLVSLTAGPILKWTPKTYLHPDFYEFMYGDKSYDNPRSPNGNTIFNQLAADVWQFPLFTPEFCDAIIAEANKYGKWSAGNDNHLDPRISGGYENYPTQDIHLNQIGLDDFWRKTVVDVYFRKVMSHLYKYKVKGVNICFVVRYKFGEQIELSPHHDASVFTTNLALNQQDIDYTGGGCRFVFTDTTVTHTRKGYVNLHPGRLSHYHEGLPVSSGTRFILVSFNE